MQRKKEMRKLFLRFRRALFIFVSIFWNFSIILLLTKLHRCALPVFFLDVYVAAFLVIEKRILQNWSFLIRRSLLAILIDDGAYPRLQLEERFVDSLLGTKLGPIENIPFGVENYRRKEG